MAAAGVTRLRKIMRVPYEGVGRGGEEDSSNEQRKRERDSRSGNAGLKQPTISANAGIRGRVLEFDPPEEVPS